MHIGEIATKGDIQELLKAVEELKELINPSLKQSDILRSADVRKMLGISDATLQRLRISGSLPAKKLNGTWFYKLEDIIKLMK